MQIIKPVLILCFLLVLVVVFRHRGRAGLRAGSRVAALLLGGAAIVSVIDPDITQRLAELLGVTRGTDLLLYALVVVFALTAMALYFGQREAKVQLQRLARRVALSDAVAQGGPPGAQHQPPPAAAGERLIADESNEPSRSVESQQSSGSSRSDASGEPGVAARVEHG